jgi:hypothetical protein
VLYVCNHSPVNMHLLVGSRVRNPDFDCSVAVPK